MKKKIMIAGLTGTGTGLPNVMHHLMRQLNTSFHVIGIGFDPKKNDNEIIKSEIFGCETYIYPAKGNIFNIDDDALGSHVNIHKPICIITIGPIVFNRYLFLQLQRYRIDIKIISYMSIEGKLVDVNYLKYINLIDCCVFYTESVYNDFNKLLLENPTGGDIKSTFIGHGIDKQTFYPISADTDKERRKTSRKIIYPDYNVNEHSFVVLNINRPYHRKKIETTLEGFKLFVAGKENIYLHLHIGSLWISERDRCYELVEELGLKNHVVITPGPGDENIKSEEWLNTLYNACDVGISTSMGEGWGLGLFEHAATRAAIVAPGHTSFQENWENAAVLMPWSETEYVFYEYSDMFIVAPEEVCTSLNTLYFDRGLLDKTALDCFNRTREPKYDWVNVAEKFKQVIAST